MKYLVDEGDVATPRVRAFIEQPSPDVEIVVVAACFYEALGVLKVKYFNRDQITTADYSDATLRLLAALAKGIPFSVRNEPAMLSLYELLILTARPLEDRVDIVDGMLLGAAGAEKMILVTADVRLEKVARGEGIRVWNPMTSEVPRE